MKIAVYGELKGRPLQKVIYESAKQGFLANGDECFEIVDPLSPDTFDVLFHWAVPNDAHKNCLVKEKRHLDSVAKINNKPIVIMEYGFLKRDWTIDDYDNTYFSFGLNNNVGFGEYFNKNKPDDRWAKLNVHLQDYRDDGNHILVCSQLPHDSSLFYGGENHYQWCLDVIKKIRRYTHRKIVFRKHPLSGDGVNSLIKKLSEIQNVHMSTSPDIDGDFNNCWAVVTFSSTSGVEALVNGIPVFSFGKGSMVYDVSDHDVSRIEAPTIFDRDEWKNGLAYCQWKFDEVKMGMAWKHLREGLLSIKNSQ